MSILTDTYNLLSGTYNAVINKSNEIIYKVDNILGNIRASVINAVSPMLFGLAVSISNIVNGIKDNIGYLIETVKSKIDYTYNQVKSKVDNIYNLVISGIPTIINTFRLKADEIKGEIVNYINGKITSLTYRIEGLYIDLKNKVIQGINSLESKIQSAVNVLSSTVERAIGQIRLEINSIANSIRGIISNIQITVQNSIDSVKLYVQNSYNSLSTAMTNGYNQLKLELETKYNSVKDTVISKFNDTKNYLSNQVSKFEENVKSSIEIIKTKLSSTFDDIKQFISKQITIVNDWISKMVSDIEKTVSKSVKDIEQFLETQSERIYGIVATELKARSKQLDVIFTKALTNKYNNFDEIQSDLSAIGSDSGLISSMIEILIAMTFSFSMFTQLGTPFTQNLVNLANEVARPELLTPPVLIAALFRNQIDNDLFLSLMRKSGYQDNLIEVMKETSRPMLSQGEIQVSFLRGKISESEHDAMLSHYGYDESMINLFKQLYFVLPPVSDIITMAVREAFSPEIAERFGQYEDFPIEFANFAKQAGLTEDWAKRYWAAHWGLPSPMQGFEMLHRGIISNEELKLLLKSLDVMPFWRERLIQLSYNPLTRVDVRRMYGLGVLDESGVNKAYKDIGYNDENAALLTRFTVLYESKTNKEDTKDVRTLTRSIIEQAYSKGVIDRNEAANRLQQIGYLNPSDIELLLDVQDTKKIIDSVDKDREIIQEKTAKMVLNSYKRGVLSREETEGLLTDVGYSPVKVSTELGLIDYENELEFKTTVLKSVQELYTEWTIDRVSFFSILSDSGFSATEIDKILQELDILRDMRLRKPTLADFIKFYKGGIITLNELVIELKGLGFHDRYISYYVQTLASTSQQIVDNQDGTFSIIEIAE